MRDFITFDIFRSVSKSDENIENKIMEKKLTDRGLRRKKFEQNTEEDIRKRIEMEKTMIYISKKESESRLKYQSFVHLFQTTKNQKNISFDKFLQEYDKIIDEIMKSVSLENIEVLKNNDEFKRNVDHTKNELQKYKKLSIAKSEKDKRTAVKNLNNNFEKLYGFLKTLLTSHWITVFKTLDDWKPVEEITSEVIKSWNEIPN